MNSQGVHAEGILGRAGLVTVKTRVDHRQMFRFKMLLHVSIIPRHIVAEQTFPKTVYIFCHIFIQFCLHIYKIKYKSNGAYSLVLLSMSSKSVLAQGILRRAGLGTVKTRVNYRQMFRFEMLLHVSTIPRRILAEQTFPKPIHILHHICI